MVQNTEVKQAVKQIIEKDGCLYYLENGEPKHRGIFELDGKIYYASKNGEIIANKKYVVHSSMAHDIVKHGTYSFDENGVLDLDSLKAPKLHRKQHKSKKKKYIKTVTITAAAALILLIAAIVSIGIYHFSDDNKPMTMSPNEKISVQQFTEPVYLCSSEMIEYYKGNKTLSDLANKPAKYRYAPFKLNYAVDDNAELIIEDETYKLSPTQSSIIIDNLKTGHHYDFKVVCNGNTVNGSFDTMKTNRFIFMDGAYNTRDIGGYMAENGKQIKQGMIIRGSEIDGLVEKDYKLKSADSIKNLNFRYDMDLRDPAISMSKNYESPLGKDVRHDFYNSAMYSAFFSENYRETVKEMFEALADSSNYPMYLHCTYGADRTGTFVFLLQGLLGVSYSDMVFEYELTGLWLKSYVTGEHLHSIHEVIARFEGNTIQEKIEKFLTDDVGLSKETINNIKAILLEDTAQ